MERTYRNTFVAPDLHFFHLTVEQTDLFIGIGKGPDQASAEVMPGVWKEAEHIARKEVESCRAELTAHIRLHPAFLSSLVPLEVPGACPLLVHRMVVAAAAAGVGPMAAVAGAVAEHVGRRLLSDFREVLVENGGDLWLGGGNPRTVGLFCGHSPLNGKIGLRLQPGELPLGLCTSSGTIGHSLSFGKADAATVKADSGALADAVATALGNRVKTAEDIPFALEWAMEVPGVRGVLAIHGDHLGVMGDMELVRLQSE